jgi:hypothetical protein
MAQPVQQGTMLTRFCRAVRGMWRRYRICRRYAARWDAKVAECFTWLWLDH